MKVLFLNLCNGYESKNPYATLVDVENTTIEKMEELESNQVGVGRVDGDWRKIMKDGYIYHTVLKKGRLSDFTEQDYDVKYTLIQGNY